MSVVPLPASTGQSAHDLANGASDALIRRWIEPNPYHPGQADARIRDAGVPVWALIGQLHATQEGPASIAAGYVIPEEAVAAALAYYHRHQHIIDDRLAANAVEP